VKKEEGRKKKGEPKLLLKAPQLARQDELPV